MNGFANSSASRISIARAQREQQHMFQPPMLHRALLALLKQHQRRKQPRIGLVPLQQMDPDRQPDGRDPGEKPGREETPFTILAPLPDRQIFAQRRVQRAAGVDQKIIDARAPARAFSNLQYARRSCRDIRATCSRAKLPSLRRFPDPPATPDAAASAGSPRDPARETESAPLPR